MSTKSSSASAKSSEIVAVYLIANLSLGTWAAAALLLPRLFEALTEENDRQKEDEGDHQEQ